MITRFFVWLIRLFNGSYVDELLIEVERAKKLTKNIRRSNEQWENINKRLENND